VSLSLVVAASGDVRRATILSESPLGQGFGAAARACMLSQRLEPALDKHGAPATTAVTLVVHFSR
jgi:hypothetical protein